MRANGHLMFREVGVRFIKYREVWHVYQQKNQRIPIGLDHKAISSDNLATWLGAAGCGMFPPPVDRGDCEW